MSAWGSPILERRKGISLSENDDAKKEFITKLQLEKVTIVAAIASKRHEPLTQRAKRAADTRASELPARDPSTGQEEAEGEPALSQSN
jgi:hypothetical protein